MCVCVCLCVMRGVQTGKISNRGVALLDCIETRLQVYPAGQNLSSDYSLKISCRATVSDCSKVCVCVCALPLASKE